MLDLFAFCALILALIAVGMCRTKGILSNATYLFANRNTSFLPLTATLVMTEFNSATLIAFSSLGYLVGFRALLLPFIFLIGLLFYAFTVAKKWKEFNGSSVADLFTHRYGKGVGVWSQWMLMSAMIGFSAVYVKSLTLLFLPLFPGWTHWGVSASLLLVVTLMHLRGGLIAIIRTDLLSALLVGLFFPYLAFKMALTPPISTPPFTPEALPMEFLISLIILTMFTYIIAPWYGQKIFAAKSPRIALWSVICAALVIAALYGCAILAAILFRYQGGESLSPEEVFPALIHAQLPIGLRGAAYALLFATSATTLTGVWSALTAMWMGKREGSYRKSMQITALFALLSFVLANTLIDQVFEKMILANIPAAALAFSLLAAFYWKGATRKGAIASIAVGCAGGIASYLFCAHFTWVWAVYALPLSFLIGIALSLIDRETPASIPTPK